MQPTVQKWWSITWTPRTPSRRDLVPCLLDRASAYKSQSIPNQLCLCTKFGLDTDKSVPIVHALNQTDLKLDLRGLGVSTKEKNKRELVELCAHHQIAVSKNVEKIKEGWVGKPKGLLQVLWVWLTQASIWRPTLLPERKMQLARSATVQTCGISWGGALTFWTRRAWCSTLQRMLVSQFVDTVMTCWAWKWGSWIPLGLCQGCL